MKGRFTESDVKKWRDDVRSGRSNPSEIAKEVDAHPSTVWRAVTGETYAHVPGAVEPGSWEFETMDFQVARQARAGEELVAEWRRRKRAEDLTFKEMGDEYGYSMDTVRKAVHGVTYAHLKTPRPIPRDNRSTTNLTLHADEIWANPEVTVSEWAERFGLDPDYLANAMRRDGWHVEFTRRWGRAPCSRCSRSTDANELHPATRLCKGCRENDVAVSPL
jgi:hypothetical protein